MHNDMTPATRAVFDALHYLGQGNVHELVTQSNKARSTVDKAIKTLADARLIVAVDTDADAAEGMPTRWTLAEAAVQAATAEDTSLAEAAHADDTAQPGHGDVTHNPVDDPQLGTESEDRDTLSQANETTTDDQDTSRVAQNETGPGNTGADNDNQTSDDHDNPNPDGATDDHYPHDQYASEQRPEDHAPQAEDPADENEDDDRNDNEPDTQGDCGLVTVVQPTRPGDRKIMTIKAVIAEYGDAGATLDEIIVETGIGHPTASRLLTAMEQADAVRCLPGTPRRWIAGPTKASEVDPNPQPPRCPVCYQVLRAIDMPEMAAQLISLARPDRTLHVVAEDGSTHVVTLPNRRPARPTSTANAGTLRHNDLTANADGSQPFGKGELEQLTLAVLTANPGRPMTPKEIAAIISTQLGGRAISAGAVRNNCTKAAAKGEIELASETPLAFTYPTSSRDADPETAPATQP